MSLSLLPPELLDHIFQLAGGDTLLNAWKSGNKELNQKLAQGIRSVVLIETTPNSTSRWPKLLSQFINLEVLHIRSYKTTLYDTDTCSNLLLKLSPKLKELIIRAPSAGYLIFPPAAQDDYHLSRLFDEDNEHVIVDVKSTSLDHSKRFEVPLDLQSIFPGLETLELSPCRLLEDRHVKYLPRSLTSLKIDEPSKITDACIQDLPRGLKWLWFENQVALRQNAALHLPPQLTYLRLAASIDLNPEHLPRTLTEFHNYSISLWSPEQLPPALSKLDLSSAIVNNSYISKLPKGIKELNIRYCKQNEPLCLHLLPPALTKLELHRQKIDTDETSLSLMPKTLKYLNLQWVQPLGNLCSHLPFGLLELNVRTEFTVITPEHIASLPKSITNLIITANNMNDEVFKHLPRSLTSLDLVGPTIINGTGFADLPNNLNSFKMHTTLALSADVMQSLPRSLVTLHISAQSIPGQSIPLLPPHLSLLHLSTFEKAPLIPFIELLPQHITRLEIAIDPADETVILLSKYLQNSLTWLSLLGMSRPYPEFTSRIFEHLPRKLTGFECQARLKAEDKDVQNLPRNLYILSLGNVYGLTEQCVQYLPKRLGRLIVTNDICQKYWSDQDRRSRVFEEIDMRVCNRWALHHKKLLSNSNNHHDQD